MKLFLCMALVASWTVTLANDEEEDFLVRQGGVVVTVEDIDALAENIPEDLRLGVMDDPNRISGYLNTIVLHRAVAAEARRQGVDQDPLIQREIQIQAEGILAKHHVSRSIAALPQPDYELLAAEHYRANRDQYKRKDLVDVSHILVATASRGDAEALARAREVRERLEQDPQALESLVAEYSDDPSSATNRGRFKKVSRGQMAPEFEAAAFALAEPGDISEPVKTQFGYHVIVLHKKTAGSQVDFDQAKGAIIADLKKKHEEQMRQDFLDRFRTQPMDVNEAGVFALRTRYAKAKQ